MHLAPSLAGSLLAPFLKATHSGQSDHDFEPSFPQMEKCKYATPAGHLSFFPPAGSKLRLGALSVWAAVGADVVSVVAGPVMLLPPSGVEHHRLQSVPNVSGASASCSVASLLLGF